MHRAPERVVTGPDNIVITDRGAPRPQESDEPRIKNQFLVPKKPPLSVVITGLVIYSRFSVRGDRPAGPILPLVPWLVSVSLFLPPRSPNLVGIIEQIDAPSLRCDDFFQLK